MNIDQVLSVHGLVGGYGSGSKLTMDKVGLSRPVTEICINPIAGEGAYSVAGNGTFIAVAFGTTFRLFDKDGNQLMSQSITSGNVLANCIAFLGNYVYYAEAGFIYRVDLTTYASSSIFSNGSNIRCLRAYNGALWLGDVSGWVKKFNVSTNTVELSARPSTEPCWKVIPFTDGHIYGLFGLRVNSPQNSTIIKLRQSDLGTVSVPVNAVPYSPRTFAFDGNNFYLVHGTYPRHIRKYTAAGTFVADAQPDPSNNAEADGALEIWDGALIYGMLKSYDCNLRYIDLGNLALLKKVNYGGPDYPQNLYIDTVNDAAYLSTYGSGTGNPGGAVIKFLRQLKIVK